MSPHTSQDPQAASSAYQPRRKFLKTALAGAFAAPVVASLAVDHLTNTARAQQAYVPPMLLSFTRISPSSLASPPSANAAYQMRFSQPMDPGSTQHWTMFTYDDPACAGPRLNAWRGWELGGTVHAVWSDNNTTLTVQPVDEVSGAPGDRPGSTYLLLNLLPAPGDLLGANGLPATPYQGCIGFGTIPV